MLKQDKPLENIKFLDNSNLLPLAFIGDSVHTLFVREYILSIAKGKLENYHSKSARLCKASSQAKVLKDIIPLLTEEENDIVRRARNAKPKHQAKNASSADYSYATAFEALIGYLYILGRNERLEEILNLSCEKIIEVKQC